MVNDVVWFCTDSMGGFETTTCVMRADRKSRLSSASVQSPFEYSARRNSSSYARSWDPAVAESIFHTTGANHAANCLNVMSPATYSDSRRRI